MKHDVLILGGGYAGVLTALRLSRRLRGRARITLASASDVFVERIRQHQVAAGALLRRHSLSRLLAGSGVSVNGWPALITLENGRVRFVLSMESDGQVIHALYSVLNPDELVAVARALALEV